MFKGLSIKTGSISDLRIPPSNRLEKLKGKAKIFYSIRINDQWRITADTALRLSSYFGNSAKFWLGLQDDYDLEEEKDNSRDILLRIKSLHSNGATQYTV